MRVLVTIAILLAACDGDPMEPDAGSIDAGGDAGGDAAMGDSGPDAGACAEDCAAMSEGCSRGACDEATGSCVLEPLAAGTSCDDGDRCTSEDVCDGAGSCAGVAIDCGGAFGPCAGECDPASGECVDLAYPDCTACGEGSVCVAGECAAPDTSIEHDLSNGVPSSWRSSGDAPWEADPSVSHEGGVSLASGRIGPSQRSTLEIRVDPAGPARLTFFYRVSTEREFDGVAIALDGAEMLFVSGEQDWTRFDRNLSAGAHTLTLTFEKDRSISEGEDRVWIDDVVLRSDTVGRMIGGPIEGFEAPALPPEWSGDWILTTSQAYEGTQSITNADIDDSQMSEIGRTIVLDEDGGVAMMVRTDTEERYDFFELFVDGELVTERSGVTDWTIVEAPLDAGMHTILLRYRKDLSISTGTDQVWVDAFRFGPFAVSGALACF